MSAVISVKVGERYATRIGALDWNATVTAVTDDHLFGRVTVEYDAGVSQSFGLPSFLAQFRRLS